MDSTKNMNAALRIMTVGILSLVFVSSAMGEDVEELIDQLGSLSKDKAKEASNKLAAIGRPVVPEVAKALRSRNRHRRRFAARALREIGQDADNAIPALFESLDDSDALTREYAVEALAKMTKQANQVLPMLKEAMENGDKDLREQAGLAIIQLTKSLESQGRAESDEQRVAGSDSAETAINSKDMNSTVQQERSQSDSSNVNTDSDVNPSTKREFTWPAPILLIRAALLTFVLGGFFMLLYVYR